MADRILPLGDAAFTLELDARPAPAVTARLLALAAALAGRPGVADLAPAFRSLTVHLDPLTADRAALEAEALRLAAAGDAPPVAGRAWRAPVCFDADFGPDQAEVAAETGLAPDAVIALLTAAPLTVLAVGFLPGFPFCGPLPDALALPRRKTPRLRVPPGSLAIANGFAGIYPWESPGGWRILGHCPLPLFDARRAAPALLAPGDALRLDPVDADEHARLRKGVAAGEIGPEAFLEDAA